MVFRAILIDRDGVINADSPDYILSPDQWQPLPGSIEAIARLNRAGLPVGVCTNQSAVGRGLISPATLEAIHARMQATLEKGQAHIDAIAFCPHAPEADCACRKPKPGLIEKMLTQWGLNRDEVVFIGDSQRDLDAAQAAGVVGWLVRTGNGRQTEADGAGKTPTFDDLNAAVTALLTRPVNE